MMSETELQRIYDSIDGLDEQYKKMLESIIAVKTCVDTLSVDNRSINTSIQNLTMSFGALKERTDAIVSSLKMLSETKDNMLDSASRETTSRFTDFRSLCDTRVAAMEFKINASNTYTDTEIEVLKSEIKTDMEALRSAIKTELSSIQAMSSSNNASIDTIMSKAYWAAWATIVNLAALCIWLVKLLGTSYGWWT
jgi:chromosome segregation ATPase